MYTYGYMDDNVQTVCAGYCNTPNGFKYYILAVETAERWSGNEHGVGDVRFFCVFPSFGLTYNCMVDNHSAMVNCVDRFFL